jgi:transposase
MYNFVTPERDQLFLMAPDTREWLPARHLAWGLLEQAAGMDISPFLAWYRPDGQGRRAYHPAVMVTLVLYCYCKGIRSSRAIEMATFDDVGARVIMGNLHPDHSTVARFVDRHKEPVKGLLVQSLAACAKEGLVSVDVVAGDGTKVKASASMAANATAEQLDLDIAELETLIAAEVSTWMAQARAEDEAEDALLGDADDAPGGPRGGGRPGTPKRTADKLLRRQKAKARLAAEITGRQEQAEAARAEKIARLERRVAARQATAEGEEAAAAARVAHYQQRAEAKAAAGRGGRVAGREPAAADSLAHVRSTRQRAETAQRDLAAALAAPATSADPARPPKANTTDPSSRVMPGKQGGFLQGYNPQVIAGAHQVIISIGTHDSPNDVAALHPALKLARANLDAAGISDPIAKALFDAGYASEDNFTTACEAELYVAITREARQTGRLRDGRKQATAYPGWQAMTARLDTPEGKAPCKKRSAMIEPVFAQLFARLGRQLNYRDTRTDLELHLWAASHNLLKAIRARARSRARSATRSLAPAS